jgi:hypothetical protein
VGSLSDKNDKAQFGYGRPPKSSRWRPGQTGNPKRIRAGRPPRADAIIDALLDARLKVFRNGKPTTLTGLQAIAAQLLTNASSGNQGALRALLRLVETAPPPEGKKGILVKSSGPNPDQNPDREQGKIRDPHGEPGKTNGPEGEDRKTRGNDDD